MCLIVKASVEDVDPLHSRKKRELSLASSSNMWSTTMKYKKQMQVFSACTLYDPCSHDSLPRGPNPNR